MRAGEDKGPFRPDRGGPRLYHPPVDELLTVAEIAESLRVSTMTVYRLIRTGELPTVRVGRNYHMRRRDLAAFLDGQVVTPAAHGDATDR